jgi:3-(3-hydroxy-phenyl)propionate hydroxylase
MAALTQANTGDVARMTERSDRVLIVGAGPVGLVCANALADAGIPVTVIEASRELPKDLRASTFHPPTLDMLDALGVSQTLVDRGLICPTWQFRDRATGVVATFDLGMLANETAHPYRLQCEQWKLTETLRARLEGRAEVIYEATAEEFTQGEDGVSLTIGLPDGSRQTLNGRYLVGTDGARSVIRKGLGVAFEGQTIPEIFLSMSTPHPFHETIPDLASIAYISDPDEWLVLLRTPTLWRVLLPTDPTLSEDQVLDPDRLETRLQAICPIPGRYPVAHVTAYRVHERVAASYVAGRVILAGDAAHLNNPLGGMGMNGGIHDAFNLAGALTSIYGGGGAGRLDQYGAQRRRVALEAVQAQTLRNRRMLAERDPAARAAYHDEMRRTVADPAQHKAFLMRSSMIQSLRDLDRAA